LLATFELDAGGRFRLENAEARLAGGMVRAGPSEGWPFEGRMEAELEVIDVDLGRLLRLVGMEEDLEAEGVLSGHIPLALSPQGAVIAGGQLTANAPGVIRYRPSETPAALQQGGGVDLMLQALSDFRY